MSKYDQIVALLEKKCGDSLPRRLRMARLYWGPRNYSRASIREELGEDVLFDEWIVVKTGRTRWLLNFHDQIKDMTDPQEIMDAILNCKNWPVYAKLWKQKANPMIRSRWILLYALVDMTVQGGKTEKAYAEEMRAKGHTVEKSSSADDAKGIDYWVDGQPKQVKSAGTKAGAKRHGKGEDWV